MISQLGIVPCNGVFHLLGRANIARNDIAGINTDTNIFRGLARVVVGLTLNVNPCDFLLNFNATESPSDGDDTTWTKLEILSTEKGLKNDTDGVVEFLAQCDVKGNASHIHETSNFLHEDGRWYYLDAQVQQPVKRHNPKIGRNDP